MLKIVFVPQNYILWLRTRPGTIFESYDSYCTSFVHIEYFKLLHQIFGISKTPILQWPKIYSAYTRVPVLYLSRVIHNAQVSYILSTLNCFTKFLTIQDSNFAMAEDI